MAVQNNGFLKPWKCFRLVFRFDFHAIEVRGFLEGSHETRATNYVTRTSGKRLMTMAKGFLRQCCQATILSNWRRYWLTSTNTVSYIFIHSLSYNSQNACCVPSNPKLNIQFKAQAGKQLYKNGSLQHHDTAQSCRRSQWAWAPAHDGRCSFVKACHSEINTHVSNNLNTNEAHIALSTCLCYNNGPSHYPTPQNHNTRTMHSLLISKSLIEQSPVWRKLLKLIKSHNWAFMYILTNN